MTLSQTVNKVIKLGREIREYYEAELPRYHRDYPLIREGEQEPPPPPAELELQALFDSLPEDMIYQVLLIMNLGRESIGVEDLADEFADWKKSGQPQYAVLQMTHYAPLANYLEEGLDVLRQHKIDVNKIPWKRARARKR